MGVGRRRRRRRPRLTALSSVLSLVPEVEGEGDSISSLCTQITSAFSGAPEDPFSSAPMPRPASSPQSPAAAGKAPGPGVPGCAPRCPLHDNRHGDHAVVAIINIIIITVMMMLYNRWERER